MAGIYINIIRMESGVHYDLRNDEDANKLLVLLIFHAGYRVQFHNNCFVVGSQKFDLKNNTFEFDYFSHPFILSFLPSIRKIVLTVSSISNFSRLLSYFFIT